MNEPIASILPLNSENATLEMVGGKGANLARLAQAGLPVPNGFLISTAAYRAFVAANHLEPGIAAFLATTPNTDSASARIRALFSSGRIPEALRDEILAAYTGLGCGAVAVRSSATAEDLPDLSFAGQQDTFLNIIGEDALIKAVLDCWGSLWTARAIEYRARNLVDHSGVALAVVVQRMVPSRASGVLFTANPLSGLRSETVIDAALGLGEALVSGQVDPDHYVVDPGSGNRRRFPASSVARLPSPRIQTTGSAR